MILCAMYIPPDIDGDGSFQRAYFLLDALCAQDAVHLVLLQRPGVPKLSDKAIAAARTKAAAVTVIDVPRWHATSAVHTWLPWGIGRWIDLARIGGGDTPRLGRRAMRALAAQLPIRDVDTVFAARLEPAMLLEELIGSGALRTRTKVVDFDDIMSKKWDRQLRVEGASHSANWRLLQRIWTARVRNEEIRIASGWDAASVCTDEDVEILTAMAPAGRAVKVPNVIDRALLAPREGTGFRLLFVGNLAYPPNIQGLGTFLDESWPAILSACPDARLDVVGREPVPAIIEQCSALGIALHADVPRVEPYYADCDAVICPIHYGGGTRIKLLEAMAFGRAIVSTNMGAEGLGMVSGEHAILADTSQEIADGVIRLAGDRALRARLAANARDLQQRDFGPPAIAAAVRAMIDPVVASAER